MTLHGARRRAARAAALWTLVIGFGASVLVGLSPASWLQQRLRFGCELAGRDWFCDDQAVLVWPAVGIIVLGGLALGWSWLIVRATWEAPEERAGQIATFAVLAVAPTLIICGLLLVDAARHDASGVTIEASRIAMWVERAMLPALLTAVSGGLAFGALRMRALGQVRRVAAVQLVFALVLLFVAAAISSLGTLPSNIIAAAAIGAGWYIASASAKAA
ncbi:hypothetical protein [Agrococcus beijingensis]|uniref:hypothetical protein n=1 Tax=Agrococcus beijingensis TaxID=3068634 RepID=UPI002740BE66|nr:hypothetical protein [Agrococcus sp. REN33]